MKIPRIPRDGKAHEEYKRTKGKNLFTEYRFHSILLIWKGKTVFSAWHRLHDFFKLINFVLLFVELHFYSKKGTSEHHNGQKSKNRGKRGVTLLSNHLRQLNWFNHLFNTTLFCCFWVICDTNTALVGNLSKFIVQLSFSTWKNIVFCTPDSNFINCYRSVNFDTFGKIPCHSDQFFE